MQEHLKAATQRLSFLGTPLFLGFSDRPFPMMPWEGGMVRLSQELRLDGASVWYRVVGPGKRGLVLFAVEPRGA